MRAAGDSHLQLELFLTLIGSSIKNSHNERFNFLVSLLPAHKFRSVLHDKFTTYITVLFIQYMLYNQKN